MVMSFWVVSFFQYVLLYFFSICFFYGTFLNFGFFSFYSYCLYICRRLQVCIWVIVSWEHGKTWKFSILICMQCLEYMKKPMLLIEYNVDINSIVRCFLYGMTLEHVWFPYRWELCSLWYDRYLTWLIVIFFWFLCINQMQNFCSRKYWWFSFHGINWWIETSYSLCRIRSRILSWKYPLSKGLW